MIPLQVLKCMIIFTILYILACAILDVDTIKGIVLYPLFLIAYTIYCMIVYRETHPTIALF